jgi:hypothetical protein
MTLDILLYLSILVRIKVETRKVGGEYVLMRENGWLVVVVPGSTRNDDAKRASPNRPKVEGGCLVFPTPTTF